MLRGRTRRLRFALLLVCATAACGTARDDARPALRIAAAASTGNVLAQLEPRFESDRRVDVRVSVGGSTLLARQVAEGAPTDVLLTADRESMDIAHRAGKVETPVAFAENRAVVVAAPSRSADVRTLADLANPGVLVVLCDQRVPCGRVADRALAQAGIELPGAARELDVNAVMTRVRLGEADAGIAYATDAKAAGQAVKAIEIEPSVTTTYFAAVVSGRGATTTKLARAWLRFLTSAGAGATLRTAGFVSP